MLFVFGRKDTRVDGGKFEAGKVFDTQSDGKGNNSNVNTD